jgi:hypothetical protein
MHWSKGKIFLLISLIHLIEIYNFFNREKNKILGKKKLYPE